MYYEVIYKLKGQNSENNWDDLNNTLESIKELVTQLWKWISSVNGTLVGWFESLEKFQIFERDYEFKSWNEHYFSIDHEQHLSYEDVSGSSAYIPHHVDITNRLFSECGVTFSSKNTMEWISCFKDGILHLDNRKFYFKEKSKIRDIFEMLIKIKNFKWWLSVTYEEILELFNKWWYKSILKSDINEPKIRDLIKKKIVSITEKLELEKPYMSLSVDKITFEF